MRKTVYCLALAAIAMLGTGILVRCENALIEAKVNALESELTGGGGKTGTGGNNGGTGGGLGDEQGGAGGGGLGGEQGGTGGGGLGGEQGGEQSTVYSVDTSGPFANGSVSANPGSAAEGTSVDLTVSPNSGFKLTVGSLTVNSGAITVNGSSNPYTFTMPAFDVTVAAAFEALPADMYSVTIGSFTGGSVTSDKESGAKAGETVTLTVNPNSGYQLAVDSLKVDGGTVTVTNTSSNTWTFTMPTNHVTVTAQFTAINYTINTSGPFVNGTVSASPTSTTVGTGVTLTASPNSGYQLESITVTETSGSNTVTPSGSGNSWTFNMPAYNVTVAATFSAINYAITIPSFANGSVSASHISATVGTEVTLTVTPGQGFKLTANSLKFNGTTISGSPYKFTMPASEVTIAAAFEETGGGGALQAGLYVGSSDIPEADTETLAKAFTWIRNSGISGGEYTIVADNENVSSTYSIGSGAIANSSTGETIKNLKITLKGTSENAIITKTGTGSLFSIYGVSGDVPEFTLENITLDGTGNTGTYALVVVGNTVTTKRGKLTMNVGSRITGNISTGTTGGGVQIAAGGEFVLDGGLIDKNQAANGGGVCVTANSTFAMKSGTIEKNKAYSGSNAVGGGVYAAASFTMEGGVIQKNSAESSNPSLNGNGGGVAFQMASGSFTMNGDAKIMENTADQGGGVYVGAGTFTMENGTIAGNTAKKLGAAVWIQQGTYGPFKKTSGTVYGIGSNTNNNKATGGKSDSEVHAILKMAGTSAGFWWDTTADSGVNLDSNNTTEWGKP
jgi:hypothetical protein